MPTQARTRIPDGNRKWNLMRTSGKFGQPTGKAKKKQNSRQDWATAWANLQRIRSQWKRKVIDEQKAALKRRTPGDWGNS